MQETKNSHVAATAVGERKLMVSRPKLLTPSLEMKVVAMFKSFVVGLGKLFSPYLDERGL